MTFYQWHQDVDALCIANLDKASHCFADDAELLAAYDDGVTAAEMFRLIATQDATCGERLRAWVAQDEVQP